MCKQHQRRTAQNDSGHEAAQTVVHGDVFVTDVIQDGGVKIGEVAGDFIAPRGGTVTINKAGQKRATEASVAAGPSKRRTKRSSAVDIGEDAAHLYESDEAHDIDGNVDVDGGEAEDVNNNPVVHDASTPTPTTTPTATPTATPYSPSPRYSPKPPFGEDPYSEFGEFPYSIEFINTYLSMPPNSKWIFRTGKVLEDTIFHHVRPTPAHSKWLQGNPILSWIIDLRDIKVKTWFTKAERAELLSWGPSLPPRDVAFEYAVERFPRNPTSFAELWDIIESKSRPENEPFDEARHCTAIYSNNAASSILAIIKSFSTCSWLGPQELHEGWFAGIWQPLIDRCLHCIPSLSVLRTEIKSSSFASRYRFDGIFRAQLADARVYELGCIEVARVTGATPTGKEEIDADKLLDGLYNMLGALGRGVEGDEEVMRKVQVVGIQNIGFEMRIWTMNKVGCNVALLQKGEVRSVPMELRHFGKVIGVMRSVVRMKGIIERSIEAVRGWEEKKRASLEDTL